MTATAERVAPQSSKIAGEMIDAWMSSYKTLNWSQDQMQTLASSWMDQTRTMRHDGEKVLEVLVSQAKTNVEEMARLSEATLQSVPAWDMITGSELRKQVEALEKRVDELATK